MDYSLAALKLLCVQLKDASETPSQNALTLGGILFQRAWLQVPPPLFIGSPFTPLPLPLCNSFPFCCCSQGILVSNDGDGRLLLDDGTGVIELCLSPDFRLRHWDSGMYVMVVGGYFVRHGETPMIKVHKMVDLSAFPDREAMWYLEVMEAYKLFYQPLIEEFM
ncbi:hypothetical protein H0E87_008042 [Populus deltoides]|uniref:Uncharacterized protein n=1 Tax=Populus deltoides TaxID=3696 RepID=A0A8T2YZ88_POPDE|nr:hypothetical protein H0E87_008042 [Populus deltoides]